MNKLFKRIFVGCFSLCLLLTTFLFVNVSDGEKALANDFNIITSSVEGNSQESNTFLVTFDSNGGTEVESQTIYEGEKVVRPDDPTKTGYEFISWKCDGYTWSFARDTVSKDITLYAVWVKKTYTITFDSGCETLIDSQIVNFDELISEPEEPVKQGYHVAGWKYNNLMWDFDVYRIKGDMTLVAVWEKDEFNVTFDTVGGSNIDKQVVKFEECALVPEIPTKHGYTFVNWLNGDKVWNFETDIVVSDITLTASWKENDYLVVFDSAGGSVVQIQNVVFGEKVVEPTAPTKAGYTFVCWQYNDTPWNFETDVINGQMTLVAVWEEETYVITFDSLGGTHIDSQNVKYNEKIIKPNNPVLDEYEFMYWVYKGKEWNFETDVVAGKMTLIAMWKDLKEIITFDSTGGSFVEKQRVWAGEKVEKPENPTKFGYTFVCWKNGDVEWNFETDVIADDTVLTATWTEKYYIVSFDSGIDVAHPNLQLQEGSIINEPEELVLEGHIFKGWYLGPMKWDFSKDVVESNMTLVAKWEEIPEEEPPSKITDKSISISIVTVVVFYMGITVIIMLISNKKHRSKMEQENETNEDAVNETIESEETVDDDMSSDDSNNAETENESVEDENSSEDE